MFRIHSIVMICLLCVLSGAVYGQRDLRRYMPTENLDSKKEANRSKNKPKDRSYSYIYVESTNGILYGNPCALEETHRMGFEYLVQKQSLPGGMEKEDVRWHNFWVKVRLCFTHTPFWKLILNRRLRGCRQKSGDFVG